MEEHIDAVKTVDSAGKEIYTNRSTAKMDGVGYRTRQTQENRLREANHTVLRKSFHRAYHFLVTIIILPLFGQEEDGLVKVLSIYPL